MIRCVARMTRRAGAGRRSEDVSQVRSPDDGRGR